LVGNDGSAILYVGEKVLLRIEGYRYAVTRREARQLLGKGKREATTAGK